MHGKSELFDIHFSYNDLPSRDTAEFDYSLLPIESLNDIVIKLQGAVKLLEDTISKQKRKPPEPDELDSDESQSTKRRHPAQKSISSHQPQVKEGILIKCESTSSYKRSSSQETRNEKPTEASSQKGVPRNKQRCRGAGDVYALKLDNKKWTIIMIEKKSKCHIVHFERSSGRKCILTLLQILSLEPKTASC